MSEARSEINSMWFRLFIASWSISFLALLGWLTTHQSHEPKILGQYSLSYFILLLVVTALVGVSLLAQWPRLHRQLKARRPEIVLALSSILLSLIVVEVTIRVLDPLGISYFEEAARYHLDKVPDPILVYKHAPNLQRTYQGVGVFTNELGMRDRNLEKKQDGELRVLLLGDSVTFGWGVPIEATFGRKLESRLASELRRPVRTLNTGVGSYNTVQEYAALRAYSDVIEPDLVILLYVANDIETNDPPFDPWSQVSLQGKSPPEAITILLWESWLYRLGRFVFQYSRSNGQASLDESARGVKESMEALSKIAVFCRDRGVHFVTFFYSSKKELSEGPLANLFSNIQAIGGTYGFSVADVGSWRADADIRSETNSTVDVHPNERGHGTLAAGMADFLLTQGLVNKTSEASR